jgi:hypothetical protein
MFNMARYPSGKGGVCKTFMRRFDSDPRLHLYVLQESLTAGLRKHSRVVQVS